MVDRLIRKCDFGIEAEFAKSAFNLQRADSDLHTTVVSAFAPFCRIRADDIRIETDTLPLSNANVVYDLAGLGGFARLNLDKAFIVFFNPHVGDATSITSLSETCLEAVGAFLSAVESVIPDCAYGSFQVQFMCHYELIDSSPADHIRQYVSPLQDDTNRVIGSAVTYHLGPKGPQTDASIVLDLSGEYSDCVFARISITFDASGISLEEMLGSVFQHCRRLLALVGLESNE